MESLKAEGFYKKKEESELVKKIKLDQELDSLKMKNIYQEMIGYYQKPITNSKIQDKNYVVQSNY